MIRIAFFVQWMICGGVENALVALTKELYERGFDVTIYVAKNEGEFIDKVPDGVHLKEIPMEPSTRKKLMIGGFKVNYRKILNEKKFIDLIKLTNRKIKNKRNFLELDFNQDDIPILNETYDIAVNFHMHSPFLVWYISERVKARKKFTWIHNDFENTGYNIRGLLQYLKCIDWYFGVSQKVVEEFKTKCPEFNNKIIVAENIVPKDDILQKADLFFPIEYTGINKNRKIILTVGRLEEQKGIDIIINVCSQLKLLGEKFQWFIIGEGSQRRFLENRIKKAKIEDCFHLLGVRSNPYPYFKNCDIYVQPSRHEGWGITITEARILCKPIITTDFAGAREQLRNGEDGFIVDCDENKILDKVKILLNDDYIADNFKEKLSNIAFEQDLTWLKFFN